jgi:hypothetical protein
VRTVFPSTLRRKRLYGPSDRASDRSSDRLGAAAMTEA